MFNRYFKWLESRVDSFPDHEPLMPKPTTWGFIWHYTKSFLPLLVVGLLFSIVIAFIEVRVFAFVGHLVDILGKANRATFW